jgi:quercetin dioxygenase-like cupin family protein
MKSALGVGSVAGLSGDHAVAQEATPVSQSGVEGITYLPLGLIPGVAMPDAVEMEVGRATLEPGASFPFTADDPSAAMMIVESGEITATVEDALWTISRGAAVAAIVTGTPAADGASEVVEVIDAGDTGRFAAGDVAYIPGNAAGELRNMDDDPAEILVITYRPLSS